MLAGELYDALDPDLVRDRDRARDLCQALNATRESEREIRRQILLQLFAKGGDTVWMQPPFFCDYGANIELGERVFFNFNCVVLDVCPVKIGDFTLFGPGVQILTPMHPLNSELRRQQEFGKAYLYRFGRLGGWRGTHSSWCEHWFAHGDRSRQHSYQGRTGRCVCGGKSMSRDS